MKILSILWLHFLLYDFTSFVDRYYRFIATGKLCFLRRIKTIRLVSNTVDQLSIKFSCSPLQVLFGHPVPSSCQRLTMTLNMLLGSKAFKLLLNVMFVQLRR